MFANHGLPLTFEYVHSTPVTELLSKVKAWVEQFDPICLMHPHGFYVVLLGRTDTEEWRFHYWPKGPRRILGMPAYIHTHNRHVCSRILEGQLTNVLYEVGEVETGGKPLYEVTYGGDRYLSTTSNGLLRTTARVIPVIQQRNTVRSGEIYTVERHAYHAAEVSEHIPTATLVCMHGDPMGGAKVVGLDGFPNAIYFKRTDIRASTLLDKLSS